MHAIVKAYTISWHFCNIIWLLIAYFYDLLVHFFLAHCIITFNYDFLWSFSFWQTVVVRVECLWEWLTFRETFFPKVTSPDTVRWSSSNMSGMLSNLQRNCWTWTQHKQMLHRVQSGRISLFTVKPSHQRYILFSSSKNNKTVIVFSLDKVMKS